jgi:hypothetical protein
LISSRFVSASKLPLETLASNFPLLTSANRTDSLLNPGN